MAESRRADGVYEFGDFRLLTAQRSLTARSDGRPIELTQKGFDALRYFVQHPGELLDKSRLMAAVWPNVVVEENNLNQVISALRRALGDGGAGRRFIVTVPGRGYQFVAPVREAPDSAPNPEPVVRADAGDRASIAVLPFASLSSDPEKDYFGDGIAEELIHLLARVPGLNVPARTSSFAYKGRNIDVRQIARELGVAMLLEGSVRSAGDSIRVTAQLVDAESGYHLWSQTFDRQFADVFRLQDELAGAIVQKLALNLGGPSRPLLQEDPPTRNVDAYRRYLQARSLFLSRGLTLDMIERMLGLLERSLALDPDFARAHALRGTALGMQVQLGASGLQVLDEARREAERALALDPELAAAHMLLGTLQAGRCEWLEADASYRRAIALDPKEPQAYLMYSVYGLAPAGRQRAAIEQAHRAYELAPAMVGAAVTLAGVHGLAAQDEEMTEYLRVVTDLGAPPQLPVPIFRSETARRAGQYAEAAGLITTALPAEVRALGGEEVVRLVYGAFGDHAGSAAAVSALRTLYAKLDPRIAEGWPMAILTLEWYALLGAMDEAYDIAQRIATQLEHAGQLTVINLPPLWLPELAAFRRDARFDAFTAKLGFVEYWKANGPPDGYVLERGRLVER
jgi:TolB-like protein/Tfp pilus assembly protein PilF